MPTNRIFAMTDNQHPRQRMKTTIGRSLTTLCIASILAAPLSHAIGRGQAPWVGTAATGAPCKGANPGKFGPFDYLLDKDRLAVVENHHFTPQVEQLKRGVTTVHAIGDINYTLVKFPNHHRALYSTINWSLSPTPKSAREKTYPPAECYLQRAMQYSPSDYVPVMLYGLYLHRLGHLEESITFYRRAEKMAPNDINLQYNLGLVLYDAGEYEESARYAKKAYDGGMNPPGLKRKLEEKGYWE